MAESEPPDTPPLPPTTVSTGCQLSCRGFPDEATALSFGAAINSAIVELGRVMDLSLLDGVTVGYDYDDALASVDLGYESTVAKTYSTGSLVGVAKFLRVLRDGKVRAHVVYHAPLYCKQDIFIFYIQWLIFLLIGNTMKNTMLRKGLTIF